MTPHSRHKLIVVLTAVLGLAAFASPLHAAGSLTPPPGAPSPVMKTLDEIEPRIPLVSGSPGVTIDGATGAITISQSGSYYLTKDLSTETATAGITVSADHVTLDLNGFSITRLTGTAANLFAIDIGSSKGVHIHNGTIVGGTTVAAGVFTKAGWYDGIHSTQVLGGPAASGMVISDIIVRGVQNRGIFSGTYYGNRVERCLIDVCGDIGIMGSVVLDCIVRNAGSDGINAGNGSVPAIVSRCYAESVGSGFGIDAGDAAVSDSVGVSVTTVGLAAHVATNCQGTSSSFIGLFAESAINCTGTSSTFPGLSVTRNAENCTGTSTSATSTYPGLKAVSNVSNCRGDCAGSGEGLSCGGNASNSSGTSGSGTGLAATCATNCTGTTSTGAFGMDIAGTASFCRGTAAAGATAIRAAIAIGCSAASGNIVAPQKHLGTP